MHPLQDNAARVYACIGEHEQYSWNPMPWPGIFNKVLFCDPIMGTTIELAKIEKGATFPVHYHTTVQTLFLISGRVRAPDRTIVPGVFDVIPAGHRHGGYFGEEESIQFKFFSAVPTYLTDDGNVYFYRKTGNIISAGRFDFAKNLTQANFLWD